MLNVHQNYLNLNYLHKNSFINDIINTTYIPLARFYDKFMIVRNENPNSFC